MRKSASKEITYVELCETEVSFLHIQLVGTNVWLPKMHKSPAYDLRDPGAHWADIQAHSGAISFPPEGSVNAVAQLFATGPLPANTFSVPTITDGCAKAGPQRMFTLPLRRPDCTLSRLVALTAEEYDRPVTHSTATTEPGCPGFPPYIDP